ncbi:MAG: endonuclease/exonuclease/phosphatase family protein [Alphaproteobacteria bacterium]|nr:endonuclease/exonuclease/phosphatase family protein [Alphaproteobacteria bacterium]
MKLVSYNVQYGLGKDGRYDLARIAGEIEDADIIALQEVERFWKRSGMVDQPAELARHLPDFHWVYGANLDIDASYPGDGGNPVHRRRQFGTMILCRMPIISTRNFPLPKLGAVNQHSIQQGALEVVIDTPKAGPLRVYSLLLSHLSPDTRLPQIDALLDIDRRAADEGGAWCGSHPDPKSGWTEGDVPPMPNAALLMGDFNFEPQDEEYCRLVGPWSRQYGRVTPLSGFVDAWVTAGHGEREGVTSKDGKRIDYIFASSSLANRIRTAWIDRDAKGSDHQPFWCSMDL